MYFKASEQTPMTNLYFGDIGSYPPFLKLHLPKVGKMEELEKGWDFARQDLGQYLNNSAIFPSTVIFAKEMY